MTPSASVATRKERRPRVIVAADHGIRSVATPRVPGGRSALLVGCQLQPAGEILEPHLRRSEEELRLLGAQRVTVQRMLDDVAGSAVQLMREQGDLAVRTGRPGLRYGDLPVGRAVVRETPQRLARDVPGAFQLDRHHRDHLLDRLERAEPYAELLALADVTYGHVENGIRAADEIGTDERRQGSPEAFERAPRGTGFATHRGGGQRDAVEADGALPILAERR